MQPPQPCSHPLPCSPLRSAPWNPENLADCGRTSWFGESGARDAFEGLAEVMRRRLRSRPRQQEPWTASRTWPLSRVWYFERAKWYKQLVATHEPRYTLLRGVPPALHHRRALAAIMGISPAAGAAGAPAGAAAAAASTAAASSAAAAFAAAASSAAAVSSAGAAGARASSRATKRNVRPPGPRG